MKNTAEMFRQRVLVSPERRALTHAGQHYSWQELYNRADAIRERLRRARIGRGDVVAIMAEHSPGQVAALLGTLLNDSIFTLVNTHLKYEQVSHQLADSDAALLIAQDSHAGKLEALAADRGTPMLVLDEAGGLADARPAPAADAARLLTRNIPTDVACLIYTSGSTGRAKGVVVPHRTLTDGARIVSGYLKITDQDRILSLLPYSFDYGLNQLLSAIHQGASLVLFRFAFPQDLIDTLVKERVTGFAGVPSIWPQLLQAKYANARGKSNFPDLRYMTTGGGAHSEEILRGLVAFFPRTEVIIIYGLTESFRSSYLPHAELLRRPGSIGKAVPEVELLVLNEAGEPCKPGEIGELYHRGAFITYGYLNNPELTAQKFVDLQTGGQGCLPEKAVRSGDLVHVDQEGFIYFHGRADLQIKSRGFRVSPGEVEDTAQSFPGMRTAAAVGVPSPEAGELVVLAYDTFDRKPLDEKALSRHLKSHLPYYAVPASIHFLEQMPLTQSGKVAYSAVQKIVRKHAAKGAGGATR